MAPVAERPGLGKATPAQLDLPGDFLGGRDDLITGVVHDPHRTLDDDGTGGLERDGDRRRRRFGGFGWSAGDSISMREI
jgi:hypothetical protein